MTDGKDQSPVRRPVVVAAILLVAVALLLVALRWSLENELVADLPVAGEQEASAPVPQAEPQVEPAADPPSVDSVAAISPPLIQAMVPLKVILLPARSDDPDPAAAILADEIRQQTLGALRRMENIDVVDVGPAEFAAVVPASAGPLWTDRQVYLAISRQYGGVSAAEIAVESSEDTTRWESRLAVVRERGSLNAGAGVSKNGAASPGADIESIGLKYAEEIANDNSGERDAEAAIRNDARNVLIDATLSEDERVRALTSLINRRDPGNRHLDSESIMAAVELAVRSVSPEIRRQIWATLRLTRDAALALPMSMALLSDPDPAVRREAALGLNEYVDAAGIRSALQQAAGSDGSAEVRLAARIATMDFGQQAAFTRETLLDRSLTPADRLAPSRMVEMQTLMGAFRDAGAGNADVELAYAEIIGGTDDSELMLSALSGIQAMTRSRSLFGGERRDPDAAFVRVLVDMAEVEDERVRRAALGAMRAYSEQPEIRAVLESVPSPAR